MNGLLPYKSVALVPLLFLIACAAGEPVYRETAFMNKSYDTHRDITTTAGDPMITAVTGTKVYQKSWVGCDQFSAPYYLTYLDTDAVKDGWQENERVEGIRKKELIYSGMDGSVINLLYREYDGSATPAKCKAVTCDIGRSRVIQFQNFTFEVVSATFLNITFKVLAEPREFIIR